MVSTDENEMEKKKERKEKWIQLEKDWLCAHTWASLMRRRFLMGGVSIGEEQVNLDVEGDCG